MKEDTARDRKSQPAGLQCTSA